VASVCAYEEEGNIAHVLEKMPVSVNGEPYTTVVVVDGATTGPRRSRGPFRASW